MTKSKHWEQFSAYRPMIADARSRERGAILDIIVSSLTYDDWGNAKIPDPEALIQEIKERIRETDF